MRLPGLLILVGWLLLAIPLYGTPLEQQETSKTTNHQGDPDSKNAVPHATVVNTEQTKPFQSPTEEKDTGADNESANYAIWGFWVNALLVIATLAIAIFSVVQAFATRKAAEATQRSADALVASERAWILVELARDNPFLRDGFVTIKDGPKIYSTTARVQCRCTNQGNTPCWITGIRAKLLILESVDSTDSLPEEPDLASTELIYNRPRNLAAKETVQAEFEVTCQQQRQLKVAVIYGAVMYRHLFDETEVPTVFGYKVTPSDHLLRLENPKYNKNY